MKCPKCGALNNPNDRFCVSCGTNLNPAPPPTAAKVAGPFPGVKLNSKILLFLIIVIVVITAAVILLSGPKEFIPPDIPIKQAIEQGYPVQCSLDGIEDNRRFNLYLKSPKYTVTHRDNNNYPFLIYDGLKEYSYVWYDDEPYWQDNSEEDGAYHDLERLELEELIQGLSGEEKQMALKMLDEEYGNDYLMQPQTCLDLYQGYLDSMNATCQIVQDIPDNVFQLPQGTVLKDFSLDDLDEEISIEDAIDAGLPVKCKSTDYKDDPTRNHYLYFEAPKYAIENWKEGYVWIIYDGTSWYQNFLVASGGRKWFDITDDPDETTFTYDQIYKNYAAKAELGEINLDCELLTSLDDNTFVPR